MNNEIINIDCLEGMQSIPDKSIDMILCDLPYGTTTCKWDTVIPFEPLWKQYERIICDNGAIVLTAQQPFATDVINSNRKLFRYEIIWHKTVKLGFLNAKKMPLRSHENVLVFYKKLPTYNPQKTKAKSLRKDRIDAVRPNSVYSNHDSCTTWIEDGNRFPESVIQISNWNGGGFTQSPTIHRTQKPVELFEYLIKTFTNEGNLVLDNCAGSGTTAIACINTNRNYILMEKEEKYYQMILARVKHHTHQPKSIA